jgi:hypothetical protein
VGKNRRRTEGTECVECVGRRNPPSPLLTSAPQETCECPPSCQRDPELQAMADTEIDGILLITMRHGECF